MNPNSIYRFKYTKIYHAPLKLGETEPKIYQVPAKDIYNACVLFGQIFSKVDLYEINVISVVKVS